MSATRDVDWVVVGSGFGGSVAALRLAQKGYSVRVLESGSRFADQDFARSTWDARRYFFAPRLRLRAIMRLTPFPDVLIASGAGVGGGSLGYANTLYRARDAFFEDLRWRELADWKAELAPHYQTAERMLGVSDVTFDCDGDVLLRELADALGVADTYRHTRVGVYLGEPGVGHPDPYFDGDGPARTGCVRCGECMVGCRHGAKDTLVKLADRIGGIAQSGVPEALFNVPGTAHILGGAVIAADPTHGVIDAHGQVFGYQNLLITDGSALPANPGVNPSLTITALAEHTIAHVPAAHTPEPRIAIKTQIHGNLGG